MRWNLELFAITSIPERCNWGAELDLLHIRGGRRFGFEFKNKDAPAVSRSMRIAMADLKLEHLYILYPSANSYTLENNITVLALKDIGAAITFNSLKKTASRVGEEIPPLLYWQKLFS
jgi:hypothetical protein